MSLTFVHTADWQLGARFAQFSEQAPQLRQVRLDTLSRALGVAREKEVDAFMIAGDLFEDNQVDDALIEEVVALFEGAAPLPILISPGNHDPYTGPDSVWDRRAFLSASSHIHVFREASIFPLGSGHVLAAPLQQKVSTLDPSLALDELAQTLPAGEIKIGMTHGALAIPGKHQANDFPIDLQAASRAGLDYLALGHWHQWQTYDEGRIVMPGTPEPDDFGQERAGNVSLVRIATAGDPPDVESVPVAAMEWHLVSYPFDHLEESRARVQALLKDLGSRIDRAIVRVHLTAVAGDQQRAVESEWLHRAFGDAFSLTFRDDALTRLTAAELSLLREEHPLIELVLNDLERIQQLLAEDGGRESPGSASSLNLAELQHLLETSKIPLASLTPSHLEEAREGILVALRKVAS